MQDSPIFDGLIREKIMKSKPIRILGTLRTQHEAIYTRRLTNEHILLDLMRLAKETLPNAAPLTPEERVSINEFFWSHF
jgi:hypothetical protein